jgi:hypothetical protein
MKDPNWTQMCEGMKFCSLMMWKSRKKEIFMAFTIIWYCFGHVFYNVPSRDYWEAELERVNPANPEKTLLLSYIQEKPSMETDVWIKTFGRPERICFQNGESIAAGNRNIDHTRSTYTWYRNLKKLKLDISVWNFSNLACGKES